MDRIFLELLRCPRTGLPLDVEVLDGDVDSSVRYGVLRAQGFCYPIVCGIPILTLGSAIIVELLQQRRFHEATVVAALADVERSRALPLLRAASDLRGLGTVARRGADVLQRRLVAGDIRRLYGPTPGASLTGDPLELLFLAQRRPIVEGYHYFRYRFGTPRYLVSLALWDALPPAVGPVLDVGCGAGHLTWALAQRPGSGPVIGIDPSFAQLLSAATLAPAARFVCGDGRALPLADGAFERVLSCDVLPYVGEKAGSVRELLRVLRSDGTMVLTALRNASQLHVHGGEPLGVAAWEGLVAGAAHRRVLPDAAILDRYLAGQGPGAIDRDGAEESQTISLVAGHTCVDLRSGRWEHWPHACGPLAPHPLLYPVGEGAGGVDHERHFPSKVYAVDNGRIADYLPARCSIPHDITSPEADVVERVGELVAVVALLALPSTAG